MGGPSFGKHSFAVEGRVNGYEWGVAVEKRRDARLGDCVSAGIALIGGSIGLETICSGRLEETPLVVSSTSEDGKRRGSVIGVLTLPSVRTLHLQIATRRPRIVPVETVSGSAAGALGRPFGYAAVAFTGSGCLRRLVARDGRGRQVGNAVFGCPRESPVR
jgi:hypothetical protein